MAYGFGINRERREKSTNTNILKIKTLAQNLLLITFNPKYSDIYIYV